MAAQFPTIHDAKYLLFILLALLLSISFLYCTIFLDKRGRILRLPPGPAPIPVLGNLHLLGNIPHRSLLQLSNKYGPIMQLRLGSVPAVVVSSASIATEILKTQDRIFASRPDTIVGKCISYDYADVAVSPYNPHWRYMRKVVTLELLTLKRLQQHKNLRMQELCAMLQSIQKNHESVMPIQGCEEVDLVIKLSTMGLDLMSRIILKERFTSSTHKDVLELRSLLARIVELFGVFVLADYVPWLGWFDLYGIKRQIKIIHQKVDRVLDQILREHEEANSDQLTDGPDFLDTLLDIQRAGREESKFLSRNAIKAAVLVGICLHDVFCPRNHVEYHCHNIGHALSYLQYLLVA